MQNAPREHSAILLTCIKLLFVINIFVLSILSGCFTQVLLYWFLKTVKLEISRFPMKPANQNPTIFRYRS